MLQLKLQGPTGWFLLIGMVSANLIFYQNCSNGGFAKNQQILEHSRHAESNGGPSTDNETNNPGNDSTLGDGPTDPSNDPSPMDPVISDPPPIGAGPAFMAVGHMNSSMYSCDGVTWQGYRSLDNNIRCWQAVSNNIDCDHQSSSGKGLTWGPEGFMATFGWGQPGHVEKSLDGVSWSTVDQGKTWADVAYGNGRYVLFDRTSYISQNGGQSWTQSGAANFIPYNTRKLYFVGQGDGVWIGQAQSQVGDLMISTDNGATFRRPLGVGTVCHQGSLAYSQDRIVLISDALCLSLDQGESWQSHPLPFSQNDTSLIFDGVEFKAYNGQTIYRSRDGLNWSQQSFIVNGVQPSGFVSIAKVGFHPEINRYVAISQSWDRYYDHTRYFYSNDGLNWAEVNKASGAAPMAPHPINHLKPGFLDVCPPQN